MERLGRTADPVGHDHQPAAVEQRAPELPHGEVEGERVEERPDVAGVEAVPGVGRVEQSRHVGMRDRDALGLSGGAGRVDDVREILRTGAALRISVLSRAISAASVSRRTIAASCPRQGRGAARSWPDDHRDTRVLEQYSESIRRIRGIERQVRAARLQDPEDADDQVERAFDAKADEDVWPDAEALQPVGQLVGARVQLPIAKRRPLEDDGLGVGRPRDLRLEAAMQRRVASNSAEPPAQSSRIRVRSAAVSRRAPAHSSTGQRRPPGAA